MVIADILLGPPGPMKAGNRKKDANRFGRRFGLAAGVACGAVLLWAVPKAGAQVATAPGYQVTPVVTAGLGNPTGLDEDASRNVYIAQHSSGGTPRIGVSLTRPGSARDFATIPALDDPTGVAVVGNSVYVTNQSSDLGTGQVIKYTDMNGNVRIDSADEFTVIYANLPVLIGGTLAIARGPDGLLYVGQGATSLDPSPGPGPGSTVFRFDPESVLFPPQRLPFAYGFYYPAGIDFATDGTAFITDRSPFSVDAPDELNAARAGEYFGFGPPWPPGATAKPPLVTFERYSSPAGVAWFPRSDFTKGEEVVFVALEGHPSYPNVEPAPRVVRVALHRDGGTLSATVSTFVTGLPNPYGLIRSTLPSGEDVLLVSDYDTEMVYQVNRKPLDPRDVDGSGLVDSDDLYIMMRERHLLEEGNPPEPLLTDFDEDGSIDADDLFYLAQGWEGDAAF